MKIDRENWLFITGKAGYGKTYWIKEHLKKIPVGKVVIMDYNCNDYQEFAANQDIWNNSTGSEKEIEQFLRIVYERGNCFTVLEEADNYLLYPSAFIRRFVNTARNRGIGAMVNAKRAKSIKPMYRTRFTHLILFHNELPEDIDYLEKWAGSGRGSLASLKNLEIGQYVEVNLTQSTISGVKKL